MSSPSTIYLCRTGDMLAAVDEKSAKYVRRLGEGEEVALKVTKVRSGPWHRRYWAMLSEIAPHLTEINISLGDTPAMMPISKPYDLHTALKLISGHCVTQHIAGTPYVLRIPSPTNFEELDGPAWAKLYPQLLDAIHQRALPQIDVPEVQQYLAGVAA